MYCFSSDTCFDLLCTHSAHTHRSSHINGSFLFLFFVLFFAFNARRRFFFFYFTASVWWVLFNLFEWLLFCSYCTRFYFEFEKKKTARDADTKLRMWLVEEEEKKLNKNSKNIVVSSICVVAFFRCCCCFRINSIAGVPISGYTFKKKPQYMKKQFTMTKLWYKRCVFFFPVVIAAAVVVLKGSSRSKTLALLWLCVSVGLRVCVCVRQSC